MSDDIILRKIQALGVPDPLKASAETVKVVLGAYFTKKILDEPTFRGYMGTLNPSLLILMEGLKAFSLDQSGLSHKVQNHIELAISVLKTRHGARRTSRRRKRAKPGRRSSTSCARPARNPTSSAF